jgi:hypothetical protein
LFTWEKWEEEQREEEGEWGGEGREQDHANVIDSILLEKLLRLFHESFKLK